MAEIRRKFDHDFREGAVRLVREIGKPIAQVSRDLGINAGILGNWVNADKRRRGAGSGALSEDEQAALARLRRENAGITRITPTMRYLSMTSSPQPSGTEWPDLAPVCVDARIKHRLRAPLISIAGGLA